MRSISEKNTKPEISVRKFLFAAGFRYRNNYKKLPGTPDIVLPKYKTAIFVHGCFWHGHKNCSLSKLPMTRTEFWRNKISENKLRDKKNIRSLKKIKWKTEVVWQCEINSLRKREKRLTNLINNLAVSSSQTIESP